MNWGITNWNFPFISLLRRKKTLASTAETHAMLFSGPMQFFAICPGDPSLPPLSYQVLLELPILLLQGLALPFLVEMVKRSFWMGEKLQDEGKQSDCDRAIAGQRQSDCKFSKICYQSSYQTSVGLLLHCFTATRLMGRNWNYSLILLQDYTVPYDIRHFSPLRGLQFQHPWTWFGRRQAPLIQTSSVGAVSATLPLLRLALLVQMSRIKCLP